ncbi:hypothetical protein P8C59_004640 [Phyllachora maydis]|uniref:Myotubularin phosphatase domain-containing protein n=1 Tax=Phyllachora maydis TaxID=1825666 RepID=A0AAD9MBH4_9PEZI|nr:hypothetical protein P8C59_004640 [Phyllachora maydis]
MPLTTFTKVYRNVSALRAGKTENGDLYLQDYHLIFCFPPQVQLDKVPGAKAQDTKGWFAYQIISQCTFRPLAQSSAFPSSLRIRFRDFNFLSFNFNDNKLGREAFDFIRARTCRLGSVDQLLAFHYHPPPESPEVQVRGWDFYDARAEFRRQGISEKSADLGWRISTINKDYSFAPTYPSLLVVPSKISDTTLKHAGAYRSRARIPTLTYLHPVNNCTITRSSQPFTGLRLRRSIQDESLVAACFSAPGGSGDTSLSALNDASPSTTQVDLSTESNSAPAELSGSEGLEDDLHAGHGLYDEKTGKRLVYGAQQHNLIVDARPAINSYVMQAAGLGSENMEHYKFAKKVFLNIDNIHVMRASLEKVIDAIKDADVSPYPPNQDLLVRSKWLKHISYILDGSAIIARQLSALSQLMLDPYYRTMEGFIVLIEKDWLSFGHMFQLRSGHLGHESWFAVDSDALGSTTPQPGENENKGDAIENALASAKRFFSKNLSNDKDENSEIDPIDESKSNVPKEQDQSTRPREISPVFHQFLDATYQLFRQHPTRFEFNERFLRRLLYHVHSCQYGTFLFNNESQRAKADLRTRTRSVWGYFFSRRADFTNDQYDPMVDDHVIGRERLVFPKLSDVRWWHQVFNRTDEEMNESLNAAAAAAERVAAYSSDPTMQMGSGSGSSDTHAVLTPEDRGPPSLDRSASTGEAGAFAKLHEGIAGLGLGRGIFAGSSNNGSMRSARDQELQSLE